MKIKLMADYGCFPLWAIGDEPRNLNPSELPLSPALTQALLDWAAQYDQTLNWNDPIHSGFPDAHAEQLFMYQGKILFERLQHELGQQYELLAYCRHIHDLPLSKT